MNKFNEKIKRHLSWEFFWMSLKYPVMGIALLLYGVVNPEEYSILIQIAITTGGILFTIFGIFLIRKNYKKM